MPKEEEEGLPAQNTDLKKLNFLLSVVQLGRQLQCPPQLLAPLVNMSKTGYKKNMSLLFILLVFHSKYSQKSYLFIEVKLLKEKKTVDIK